MSETIEHIVLLNVKPDADSTKVQAMIDEVNGLASLGLTFHISAGQLLPCTTSTSTSNFTHILHCRFASTDRLRAYYDHPEHLRVVAQYIQPVIDDAVAVDWISHGITDSLKPGSVMRVTLLKLKEHLVGNEKAGEVAQLIQAQTTQQIISVGENFAHEMSKGYSIAMIAVGSDADQHTLKLLEDFIETASEVVVYYVVP